MKTSREDCRSSGDVLLDWSSLRLDGLYPGMPVKEAREKGWTDKDGFLISKSYEPKDIGFGYSFAEYENEIIVTIVGKNLACSSGLLFRVGDDWPRTQERLPFENSVATNMELGLSVMVVQTDDHNHLKIVYFSKAN